MVSFMDAHWKFSVFLMTWPFYILMSCVMALLIFSFPLFYILLRDGDTGVEVTSTGLTLISRRRDRSGFRDTFYKIPWEAIREIDMKPAFPKGLNMTSIVMLCSEDCIEVDSFMPTFFGKRVPLSFGKNAPKKFAYASRAFPSGLLIFSLPWQLQRPEEFKVALMQEAPFDHPLARFFREHPDLVQ